MGNAEKKRGRLGEREFARLAERHFIVNESGQDDEKGWDFLITFPEPDWESETPYESFRRAAEPKY